MNLKPLMNLQQVLGTMVFLAAPMAMGTAHANTFYSVALDTSAISGQAGYAIAFSFQDGSITGDNNNTVTLTGFNYGGGASTGGTAVNGGASGSLGSGVVLGDSAFSSLFTEGFTPGAFLSFNVDMTTDVDAGGTPDFFGFSLLRNGNALPTQDDTLGDNLLYFNIDSASPSPSVWATDSGSPAALNAPTVTLQSQVPEPDGLPLLGIGLAGLIWARRRF